MYSVIQVVDSLQLGGLCANEHGVESRGAFLEEQFDHFVEIGTQFVEGLALGGRF